MRSKYWNATFFAGCLSLAGLARAQVVPAPVPDNDEAAPQVQEGAGDVLIRPLPPAPAPAEARVVLIRPDVVPPPPPAALAPMPPATPRGQYFVATGAVARGDQPKGVYHMQVVNARVRDVWIGVAVSSVPAALAHQLRLDEGTGVVVESVYPNAPAQKAGIQQYDVIERIDDRPIGGPEQFSAVVRSHRAGGKVTLAIIREGESIDVTVKLSRRAPSTSDRRGVFPKGMPPQPNAPFDYQATPRQPFWAPAQPPGAMPGQPYFRPGAAAVPGERFGLPGAVPPDAAMPGQPYPDMPSAPGAPARRFWGPVAPPPAGVQPGQPDYRLFTPAPRQPGSSVRLDYENGRLMATVYSPEGKIILRAPVDALKNQPDLPSAPRRMLERLRSDLASPDVRTSKKQKARHEDDEQEDEDDAQSPAR